MESIYPELALCGSKNLFPRTDTVLVAISEVSDGTVSFIKAKTEVKVQIRVKVGPVCLTFRNWVYTLNNVVQSERKRIYTTNYIYNYIILFETVC